MPTYKSENHLRSISMDAGSVQDFDNIASVAAGVANTTIQARLPVPQRCKIFKVVANFSAIGTGGAHSFNVVQGNGAEGSVGTVDTVSPNGTVLFAADVNLAGGSADVPQVFIPTVWDAIYDAGSLLTIRAVTPATTGSLSNLKITIFLKTVNAHPAATMNPSPSGNIGFDPSDL
jgi:hypothetical protein